MDNLQTKQHLTFQTKKMKTLYILLLCGMCLAETWTHVTDETSSVKPFRSTRYAFNALVTTNGTQGIANAVKPFTDARYAINSIVVTNESGEYAMAVRLVSGDPASLEEMQAMTNGCLQTSGNSKIWLTDPTARTNNCVFFDGEYFVKWTRFYTNSTAAVTNEIKTKMVQ